LFQVGSAAHRQDNLRVNGVDVKPLVEAGLDSPGPPKRGPVPYGDSRDSVGDPTRVRPSKRLARRKR